MLYVMSMKRQSESYTPIKCKCPGWGQKVIQYKPVSCGGV